MLAKIAAAAEGLHIDGNPVTGFYMGDGSAYLFHHAHHFVTHGNSRNRPRHRTVLDVQVAGTDAAQCHTNDGIPRVLQHRLWLF